ncbi:MAG: hypothetical protein C5B56_07115 [Proteobacteria bacterium]|nr:MAG: hypothetical protein C5B56_07115 [Pseudomonadota bacterium]
MERSMRLFVIAITRRGRPCTLVDARARSSSGNATNLVELGGRIVYVICSLLAEENGDQVRAVLARHQGFAIVPPVEVTGVLGERAFLFRHAALMSEEGVLMTPRRTDTDGFFVAMLRRVA